MPVSSSLLISGVRASLKVFAAGDAALARQVRDRAFELPDALPPLPQNALTRVENTVEEDPHFEAFLVAEGLQPLFEARNTGDAATRHARTAELLDALDRFEMRRERPDVPTPLLEELRAIRAIEQWGAAGSTTRLLPWQEFAITFGRVAFDFVGTNPSILQTGGDAERLIGAFATTAGAVLEAEAFTDKAFGAQLLSSMLRAGLQTLSDERALIFDEIHVQALVERTTAPIIAALNDPDGDAVDRHRWKTTALNLLGPVSEAAFGVLAEHQTAFLGDRFDTEELLGKMSFALLSAAKEGALGDLLQDGESARAGTLRLFKAVASVAAAHPTLIIAGDRPIDGLFRDLLTNTAAAIDAAANIDRSLGLEIIAGGIDALADSTPALIRLGDADKPWESVIERTLGKVLDGLSAATTGERKLESLLTKNQLIGLSRVFFEQVAKTPGMIAGDAVELGAVVKAVAGAIADDENALMTGDDWLKIAAIAAREAGRNPGRLFGFDDTGDSLGAKLLGELLRAAGDAATMQNHGANVLFGETLRIAVEVGLKAISDNTAAGARLLKHEDRIRETANAISLVIAEQEDSVFRFGAKEWLALWREQLPVLMEGDDAVESALAVVASTEPLSGTVEPAGLARAERILRG